MGERFQFICEGCGYKALVSGGPDGGDIGLTTTVACRECGKLYDIVTAFEQPGKRAPKRRCPHRAGHTIRDWKTGDPCPRCGGVMRLGDVRMLWD